MLFPFSLCDKENVWLNLYPPNTFTIWSELSKAFLNKYFPSNKMAKLCIEITCFNQHEGELLYETWERFMDLQRRCPHHGILEWLIIRTFYNSLTLPTNININDTAGGVLMGKALEEA